MLLRFHSVESGQGIEAHNWIDPELYSAFGDLKVRAGWKDNGEVGWKQNFGKAKQAKAMKATRPTRATLSTRPTRAMRAPSRGR